MSERREDLSAVQTILNLGEEGMGEVVNLLLSNDRFVQALQTGITNSLNAKHLLDRNVNRVLGTLNVPTLQDVAQVKEKLSELEEAMGEIYAKVRLLKEQAGSESESKARPGKPTGKKKSPRPPARKPRRKPSS